MTEVKKENIVLQDNEALDMKNKCAHNFTHQADIAINGIIYDIYYCKKCLRHVKKERPCPLNLEEIT